jgi:hypothetical protein
MLFPYFTIIGVILIVVFIIILFIRPDKIPIDEETQIYPTYLKKTKVKKKGRCYFHDAIYVYECSAPHLHEYSPNNPSIHSTPVPMVYSRLCAR